MSTSHAATVLKSWAGAFVAPVVWFVQQQLVYWRLPEPCGGGSWVTILIWMLCSVIVAAAALISARQIRMAHVENEVDHARRLFAIWLAVVMPLLFLVPMTWQAVGGAVTATSTTTQVNDPGATGNKFYKLKQL